MWVVRFNGLNNGHACKRLFQIHFFVAISHHAGAVHGHRSGAYHVFSHVHHAVVIGIGFVEFHHGEFWIVARRHAFVAEIAVDFVHTLQAAYHQAFQIQFRRHAQIQIHVQSVVMGHKRFRSRTTRNGVHHRRFHFQIALRSHEIAHGLHDLAAFDEGITRFGIGNQIHIALAVFRFLVGQAFVFVRQRPQRFGQQTQAAGAHRQLTVVGFHHFAFASDDVAQIPVLESFVRFFAHALVVDVKLNLTADVLDGGKTGFTHVALEHHSTNHLHLHLLLSQAFLIKLTVSVL